MYLKESPRNCSFSQGTKFEQGKIYIIQYTEHPCRNRNPVEVYQKVVNLVKLMRFIDKLIAVLKLEGGVEFFHVEKGGKHITAKTTLRELNIGIDKTVKCT